MSTSARRLASSATVARFAWSSTARAAVPAKPVLVPVAFAQPAIDPDRVADAGPHREARELQLPSVSAEHVRAIEEEAYARGYAEGRRAADADMSRERDTVRGRLEAAIADIGGLKAGVLQRAERELLELSLAIAERVVRHQVDVDPDLLLVIARVAMERLGERAVAVIHLHPDDYNALSGTTRVTGVEVIPDTAVEPGGCLVTSASGEIDAGINAQIREMARELLGVDDLEGRGNAVARV